MFDPSKLDLDLEQKKQEEAKNLENNKEKEENSEATNETDILENIEVEEKNQEKPIQESSSGEEVNDKNNTEIIENKDNNSSEEVVSNSEEKENNNTIVVEEKEKEEENKIIYDININSLKDLLVLLVDNEYDFLVLDPSNENVKISFRKDKVEKDIKYIRFPIYSNILIKSKTIAKLNVEETDKQQEGVGELIVQNKTYKLILKTVPSELGEKVFLKLEEVKKKITKQNKKTSLGQILGFIGTLALIGLIIGGSFTTYIVLNAKTIEDVQFFYSIGINLNDINTFITKIVTVIFSILMFVETIFLIMFLFKFILTKKEFKQKKIKYGIFSVTFLIICFFTASLWMFIDQKINSLPNWQEMAYGDVQVYDNTKLKSDYFDKGGSLIEDTSNLIGPMEIKFDLSYFAEQEEQSGLTIKKFIWDFGDGEITETPNSSIIKEFDEKGIYEVSLTVQEVDLKGDIIEKVVENIPSINISYIVEKEEEITENGGIFVTFDASDLKQLGKVEWYYIEDLENPVLEGYNFYGSKAIFKETLIGMNIIDDENENDTLDKIFIINGEEESNISGEIVSTRSIENDLEYELSVNNISIDSGNGYIEEYKWIIEDKEITNIGSIEKASESSTITYEFSSYGEHNVKVILTDSSGNTKEISTTIDIPKQLDLSQTLSIYNDETLMEDIEYEGKLNEYFINELGIPTQLKFDARYIKSSNLLYTLDKVSWDFNSDGDIDEVNKLAYYDVDTEGNHTVSVTYTFKHRKIEDDIIDVTEKIYIEGVKKEAILTFDINKDNNYAPVTVSLDASKSIVKDENIVKFIWDYGDGVTEERDAIVPGHKYLTAGDYTITLKVITESGKEYEVSKKLILNPKPQSVKITTSMKKTIVGQGIDFSSEDSEGQIISYLWDFGDGTTSTKANPTHSYSKAGEYEVTLQVDFENNNVLKDYITIEITE